MRKAKRERGKVWAMHCWQWAVCGRRGSSLPAWRTGRDSMPAGREPCRWAAFTRCRASTRKRWRVSMRPPPFLMRREEEGSATEDEIAVGRLYVTTNRRNVYMDGGDFRGAKQLAERGMADAEARGNADQHLEARFDLAWCDFQYRGCGKRRIQGGRTPCNWRGLSGIWAAKR